MPEGYTVKDIERFHDRIAELEAETERLRAELDAAIDLLQSLRSTGGRVTWGWSPKRGEMGYYLDGQWAGITWREVIKQAAEAAKGGGSK